MAQTEKVHERTASADQKASLWRRIFGKEDGSIQPPPPPAPPVQQDAPRPNVVRRLSRKVVPSLPRPQTFRRQQSELRERLEPVKPHSQERRTVSVDRRRNPNARDTSTAAKALPRLSAPELFEKPMTIDSVLAPTNQAVAVPSIQDDGQEFVDVTKDPSNLETASFSTEAFEEMITEELERRWILNLSMHFRDKSKREKFFITFAETPSHWRRVTVSLDYRDAQKDSLEEELQQIHFQRDKSARIYEAIRESLQDIQFYDTVTNLKLQTENERLHVHVVEDTSEIINYPPVKAINHLKCRRVREEELVFDSHLSGFVYKVMLDGQIFIKKEIPGPDTVDEFLYEINALHQLSGSQSVIQFGGVVLDNQSKHVKGLLISFAERGALIDVIYDGVGQISWDRRQRWARQIVQGLSEIHEAGFVQGDFTLSNIVIDADDNAKIIDINRRGCPVGWEPPEVAALIESGQRISMYIGVKSDLFQLGMGGLVFLYALAFQHDEPETQRPLDLSLAPPEVPDYFIDVCNKCLDVDPRKRSQAAVLFTLFPAVEEPVCSKTSLPLPIVVEARHVDEGKDEQKGPKVISSVGSHSNGHERLNGAHTYIEPGELEGEPYYFPRRGRSPAREEAVGSDIPASLHKLEYMDRQGHVTGGLREDAKSIEADEVPIAEEIHNIPEPALNAVQEPEPEPEPEPEDTEAKPRPTAAVFEKAKAHPSDDFAGIGGALTTVQLPIQASLDDDFPTTDAPNDSMVAQGHGGWR